jgi:hypothetical protein
MARFCRLAGRRTCPQAVAPAHCNQRRRLRGPLDLCFSIFRGTWSPALHLVDRHCYGPYPLLLDSGFASPRLCHAAIPLAVVPGTGPAPLCKPLFGRLPCPLVRPPGLLFFRLRRFDRVELSTPTIPCHFVLVPAHPSHRGALATRPAFFRRPTPGTFFQRRPRLRHTCAARRRARPMRSLGLARRFRRLDPFLHWTVARGHRVIPVPVAPPCPPRAWLHLPGARCLPPASCRHILNFPSFRSGT